MVLLNHSTEHQVYVYHLVSSFFLINFPCSDLRVTVLTKFLSSAISSSTIENSANHFHTIINSSKSLNYEPRILDYNVIILRWTLHKTAYIEDSSTIVPLMYFCLPGATHILLEILLILTIGFWNHVEMIVVAFCKSMTRQVGFITSVWIRAFDL